MHGTMAADAMPASIAALGMSVALPTPRFFHSMVISKKKLFVYVTRAGRRVAAIIICAPHTEHVPSGMGVTAEPGLTCHSSR